MRIAAHGRLTPDLRATPAQTAGVHWSLARMPLRVAAAALPHGVFIPQEAFDCLLATALRQWESVLPGQIRFAVVPGVFPPPSARNGTNNAADIEVRWTSTPTLGRDFEVATRNVAFRTAPLPRPILSEWA